MDSFQVYRDIKARTDGEIYLGVVGPVRTGKSTFIKRLIIGVAFFFIPSIVDVIMWLANIVWNGMYPTCGI